MAACIHGAATKIPGSCIVNCDAGRRFAAQEMDKQNPPKAPPQSNYGCSCVKEKDLPPPPPTVLPETTWDVDQDLPEQAWQAKKSGYFEWEKTFNSPYGVMHMAGNAAEWVYDFYDPHYYGHSPVQNPQGPETGKVHVFRGGSYLSDPTQLTVYWRGFSFVNPSQGREMGYAYNHPVIGIRCAKSIALVEPPGNEENKNETISDTRQPATNPVKKVIPPVTPVQRATSVAPGWTSDFAKAKSAAAGKKLPILALFTEYDWCPVCMELNSEVLATDEFKTYAKDNLVLFMADFPRKTQLSKETAKQNQDLFGKYKIDGVPTVVLMDAAGKELARTGYLPGGGKAYVAHIKGLLKKK